MYDDRDHPRGTFWHHDPFGFDDPPHLDRLTHLVLVDGRLVDTWSEPVTGTRWEEHARRFDRERTPATPPAPPLPPPYERVLGWLDASCGGRAAVVAMTAEPLVEDGLDLPEVPEVSHRERLETIAELLDSVAERWWDAETSFALRRALVRLWAEDPMTVILAKSPAHVAGGICWAVAKANGLFRPPGEVGMRQVQDTLELRGALSSTGAKVRLALHGFHGWPADVSWPGRVVPGVPDLQPLGHVDLLLGRTREQLVRLRERALAARDAVTAA